MVETKCQLCAIYDVETVIDDGELNCPSCCVEIEKLEDLHAELDLVVSEFEERIIH